MLSSVAYAPSPARATVRNEKRSAHARSAASGVPTRANARVIALTIAG